MGNIFELKSKFFPAGDQPQAIGVISSNLGEKVKHQTLWGVTGSGKTFTMANVIANAGKPTLVIAHNKTLAAQLADEFRDFFPNNAVHYFVSYYDYYQPEAYIPHTDTYIEKDSSINDEIDRLRHAATHALLTRKDVIIVASVSCIYGIGSPNFYQSLNFTFKVGEKIVRDTFLRNLHELQFERNDYELKRGTYRLKGDTLEIFPAYANNSIKVEFFGDRIEKITETDWISGRTKENLKTFEVFPAKHFITPKELQKKAIENIKNDLAKRINDFENEGKLIEAQRIKERTNFDIEMLEEVGYCNGIENYSRYFDGRKPGEPAPTLMDYFPASPAMSADRQAGGPKDFLLIIDESHMTVPQIGAMYAGDLSRKEKLVNYGFRLPSAYDNRPLKFNEFYDKIDEVIFTSATPSEYELMKSSSQNQVDGRNKKYDAIIRQFIRPTGLLDPMIEVRKTKGQIDDLIKEIIARTKSNQRVLVTTLTKKMAEALTEFLLDKKIKVAYIHSDVDTLERIEILSDLRLGKYDVLVGINLLREGLDLPEVSLVAILDADKEGFLRSKTSLVQTIGRAARHADGTVIMYADIITESMKNAILETENRRKLQERHNQTNHIVPKTIIKSVTVREKKEIEEEIGIESAFKKLPKSEKKRAIAQMTSLMREAAEKLEFERAADLRDKIALMESSVKNKI